MFIVYSVIVFVFLFGLTILVHELAHFLMARICGLVIDKFSIGLGPAIWRGTRNGIEYVIGCIPFGGYVALPQLDPTGMAHLQGRRNERTLWQTVLSFGRRARAERAASAEPPEQPAPGHDLPAVPAWKRCLVALVGSAGNFALALCLALIICAGYPSNVPESGTVVGYVATNSPAFTAGLRPGHEIRAVNGRSVRTWSEYVYECDLASGVSNIVTLTVRDEAGERRLVVKTTGTLPEPIEGVEKSLPCVVSEIIMGGAAEAAGVKRGDIIRRFDGVAIHSVNHFVDLVASRQDREVSIDVERSGGLLSLKVKPVLDPARNRAVVGVLVGPGRAFMAGWLQYRKPWDQISGDMRAVRRFFSALLSTRRGEARQAAKSVSGPVMIMVVLWHSIGVGLLYAVGFVRFLNVNLAIFNLLPLPILDGGHIIFSLWEMLTGRKPHPRLVNALVNAFAVLLIGLFLLLTLRDIRTVGSVLGGRSP